MYFRKIIVISLYLYEDYSLKSEFIEIRLFAKQPDIFNNNEHGLGKLNQTASVCVARLNTSIREDMQVI